MKSSERWSPRAPGGRMKLKHLRIRGVRGISREVSLEVGGRSLLVHGDNGTGKSSIERALRWALLGTDAPTTEAPFSSETSMRRHILESEPCVELLLEKDGRIQVTLGAPSVVDANAAGHAYREACMRANPFLRRAEMQNVLNDKPSDRFRYLESFFDLRDVDSVRDSLEGRASGSEAAAKQAKQEAERRLSFLVGQIPPHHRPPDASRSALFDAIGRFAVALRILPDPTSEPTRLFEAGRQAQTLVSSNGLSTARAQLNEARSTLDAFRQEFAAAVFGDLAALEHRRRDLEQGSLDGDALEVLSQARTYLEARDDGPCPVCLQSVDPSELRRQLDQRLAALASYKEAVNAIAAQVGLWQEQLREFLRVSRRFAEALGSKRASELPGVPAMPDGVKGLLEKKEARALQDSLLAVGSQVIHAWIRSFLDWAVQTIDERLGRLPEDSELNDLKQFAHVVAEIERALPMLDQYAQDGEREDQRAADLGELANAIRLARQDVAKELLDQIQGLVTSYYRYLHPDERPGETTAPPAFKIQRHQGGTAQLVGTFAGKEVKSLTWAYSDGHLDTAALCVFLALRRFRANQDGDPKLLVLDDVILSIDLAHGRRLLELLREHFSDHQLLIFTHNGLFARWCKSLLPGIQYAHIRRWTLEEGPTLGDELDAIPRLEAALEGVTSKDIAMAMMALADEFLREARYAYGLAVPASRDEQYTCADLWSPFCKTLKEIEKTLKVKIGNLKELMESLRDLPQVRNSPGAHDNDYAFEYPLATLRDLGAKLLELVRLLHCDNCQTFAYPVPNRFNPSMMHCDCRHLTYVYDPRSVKQSNIPPLQ